MYLKVKRLYPDAELPVYATSGAAGLDLSAYLPEEYPREWTNAVVRPGETIMIRTGIAVEIPDGYCGKLYARSKMSTLRGLVLTTGTSVIDSDYRGDVIVGLYNRSDHDQVILKGDRIAQLVIEKYERCMIIEADELSKTQRGNGGFGSTGR